AGSLTLMLYTHTWGFFFAVGAVISLIPAYLISEDRRSFVRDAVLTFVAAGILYVPWLPNLVYQASHTGAPWSHAPGFGTPILISRELLGGDRVTITLFLGCVAGLGGLFARRLRRTPEAVALWTLIALAFATLVIAWLSSQVT